MAEVGMELMILSRNLVKKELYATLVIIVKVSVLYLLWVIGGFVQNVKLNLE